MRTQRLCSITDRGTGMMARTSSMLQQHFASEALLMLGHVTLAAALMILSTLPVRAEDQSGRPDTTVQASQPAGSINAIGPYIGVDLSAVDFTGDGQGNGGGLGASIGYRWGRFRTDLAYQLTLGDLFANRITVGAYSDLPIVAGQITPYIGGGIGVGWVGELDNDESAEDDYALTFHGEVGLGLNVTRYITIEPGYRFFWIGEKGTDQGDDVKAHVFRVGTRINF